MGKDGEKERKKHWKLSEPGALFWRPVESSERSLRSYAAVKGNAPALSVSVIANEALAGLSHRRVARISAVWLRTPPNLGPSWGTRRMSERVN